MTTPKSLFEDDFAEASIEAIALVSSPLSFPDPPTSSLPDTDCFPSPPPSPPVASSNSFSRAFSSLSSLFLTTERTLSRPTSHKSTYSDLTRTAYPSHPLPPPPTPCSDPHFSPSVNKLRAPGDQPPLAELPISLPTVYLVQYGLNWHHDVILLPHNAIRAELVDLAAMLSACFSQTATTLLNDIRLLSQWWPTFSSFLNSYLRFEDSQLLPWIYAGRKDRELQCFQNNLLSHRNTMQYHLTEVTNTFSLFRCRPSEDVAPLLLRATAKFIPVLLTYLETEERFLPIFIARFHAETDATVVERKMLREMDIRLLTRWIPSQKCRRAMRRTSMTPTARLMYYRRHRRPVIAHLDIVQRVIEGRVERSSQWTGM